MSVLDSIIEGVREDLAARRGSLSKLNEMILAIPPALPIDFPLNEMSVIAEVKRSSPSKGALAEIGNPAELAIKYQSAGAKAISVLTEQRRFNGSLADLVSVRSAVTIPILRKDFMIDEYQFYEARAIGADIVLLIVAGLSKAQLKDYYALTTDLGMSALVEVHTHQELEDAMDIEPKMIGVNSRNLKTLEVDPSMFNELLPRIPDGLIRVAESGIANRSQVVAAERAGANVILVGEALVKAGDPIKSMADLLGR
ncbi:MAG: indole-3-glycerol phosphate synthase TrpC [Candidatus Nanopelagicaceae bacterium]